MTINLDPGNAGSEDEATRRARLAAMARAAGQYLPGYEPGANVGVESVTTQPTGSQYQPGSEPTPYSPAPIPSGSVPQKIESAPYSWSGSDLNPTNSSFRPSADQLAAMQRAIAGVAATNEAYKKTGPAPTPVAVATTGGSLASAVNTIKPPVQPPTQTTTTITPPTDDRTTSNLLAQMQTASSGGGAGAGSRAGAGSGAGAIQNQSSAGAGGIEDQGGSGGSLGQLTSSIVNQLQSIQAGLSSPGTPRDVTAVYLQQSQSILKMLDDQEAQLRADTEKQGTSIDPATQFTIDKLRENLETNIKGAREDLNRRGLYDSGILLDIETKLKKGNASDQAMVLAERFSKLQNELSQGLASIRSQKASTAQSFGLAAANAQTTSDENTRRQAYDREQAALQAMLNLRSQFAGEEQAAASRSFQGQQSALEREFRAQQAELDRAYGDAQFRARTAAEFEMNKQQYEQESALIAQRAAASGSGGGGGSVRPASARTTATTAASSTNDVTQQAIADMREVFTNATEASAAIKEQMRELAAAGVDISQLYEAAQGLGGRRIGTSDY
jgi:hypothetical protein